MCKNSHSYAFRLREEKTLLENPAIFFIHRVSVSVYISLIVEKEFYVIIVLNKHLIARNNKHIPKISHFKTLQNLCQKLALKLGRLLDSFSRNAFL